MSGEAIADWTGVRYNALTSFNTSNSAKDNMPEARVLRVLYVGRRARIVNEIRSRFDATNDPRDGTAAPPATGERAASSAPIQWDYSHVTNQKIALEVAASQLAPNVVLVETDHKPNSRARFCDMLRHRLPNAAIFAVSELAPNSPFEFDGIINLPVADQPVAEMLYLAWHRSANQKMAYGPIQLDVAKRTVATPNGRYRMTPKQCALLEMLMIRHGTVVKRSEIMQSIWDTSYLEDTRTLDVHIRWLRERIEPDPSNPTYLLTVRGVGYHLQMPQGIATHQTKAAASN